jgi:hypothetical protein
VNILRVLLYFAGDLNSVETYVEFGSAVPVKVKCCINAYLSILVSFV